MKTLLFLALAACGGDEPSTAQAAPAPEVEQPAPAPAPKAEAAPQAGAGDAAHGAEVYAQFCVSCHQADGTGMNGMLAANFKTDKARLQKSDAELITSIRDGKNGSVGAMPPWKGTLSDQDMADVLAYIRQEFGE